jgi:hypothetical protein
MRGRSNLPGSEREFSRRSTRQSQPAIVTVMDSLSQIAEINQVAMSSMVEGVSRVMADMVGNIAAAPRDVPRERRHRKHDRDCDCDCDCDDCRGCYRDDCDCRCCIGDVDLVVYTRLGERRLVPVTIENSRRRAKDISLELSPWTSRGGKPAQVTAQILEPTSFTLEPCDERTVIIVINVGTGLSGGGDNTPDVPPGSTVPPERRLDVDGCEVVYADLRVTGCDIRPIRIALAILPMDCAAYEIECGCGCC